MAAVKVLVLCVDRDDDFGSKTGLKGPFVGRQKNIEAALALGLKDPEDSDVNTLLAAIGIYEEMLKKGIDAEIACILGDVKVGYESDLVLVNQLEAVIEQVKPDRAVLVSDGAEDEFIYPMIFSRVKVDSVRRVYIKQAPTVESTYYTMVKMMKDDKIRKRILTPIGLIFLVIGVFSLIPKFLALASQPDDLDVIASLTWGMLSLVIGLYLLAYAYKVGERTRSGVGRMVRAVRSGSQMIPFIIVSSILLIIGLFLGYSYANEDPNLDLTVRSLLFVAGVLWLWVFSILTYETGRFVSYYLANGRVLLAPRGGRSYRPGQRVHNPGGGGLDSPLPQGVPRIHDSGGPGVPSGLPVPGLQRHHERHVAQPVADSACGHRAEGNGRVPGSVNRHGFPGLVSVVRGHPGGLRLRSGRRTRGPPVAWPRWCLWDSYAVRTAFAPR